MRKKMLLITTLLVVLVALFGFSQENLKKNKFKEKDCKMQMHEGNEMHEKMFTRFYINSLLDELNLEQDKEREVYKILKDKFETRKNIMDERRKLTDDLEKIYQKNPNDPEIEKMVTKIMDLNNQENVKMKNFDENILKLLNTKQKAQFFLHQKNIFREMREKIKEKMQNN